MRFARPLLVASLAVASLVGAASAAALRAPADDGTLSLRDGRGAVVVRMRGGVIGNIGRGRLTVTESDTSTVVVRGAEHERPVNGRTTVYTGANIRYRVVDDRSFTLRVNGAKINFSAVGFGDVWLDGLGDQDGIVFDGTYSLNGSPYRSLPDERAHFELAAPAAD